MIIDNSTDIQIIKLTESKAKVLGDKSYIYSLAEDFKFQPKGYQWSPKYKSGLWDGYIRLLNQLDQTIPSGLLPKLIEACGLNKFSYEIDESFYPRKVPTEDQIKDFIKNLIITGGDGQKIYLYDYQLESVLHIVKNQRVTLLSPTNSGKSLIFYIAYRVLKRFDLLSKLLIVVPTTTLVEQLSSDFLDYSQKDPSIDMNENIHKIYSGKEKITKKEIVISTWQSISKLNKTFFLPFSGLIIDECHGAKGKELQSISDKCEKAFLRLGATGSLDGDDITELQITGCFGPVYTSTTTREMIDSGQSTEMDIQCLSIKYSDEECKLVSVLKYQDEIKYLINHEKRNKFITNLAGSRKGNVLVLFQFLDHGKKLVKLLEEKYPNKKIIYIAGSVDTDIRNESRAFAEKNNNVIFVASYQTFATGINIKNLHHIILGSPSKSRVRILQSIGRMLRIHKSKDVATLYDICDDLKWKSRLNYSMKHFIERLKIYVEQKYQYKIHKIST